MVYTCVGSSDTEFTIDVEMNIYRDAFQDGRDNLSGYDDQLILGIFRGSPGDWRLVDTEIIAFNPALVSQVQVPANPCFINPGNVINDKAVFRATLNLEKISENYYITYQRCCRNNSISNIPNSGQTGAVISVEITPASQSACNSSPLWNDEPDILICNGFPVELDFSVTDSDTSLITSKPDSISYKFCDPLSVGGTAGSPDNPCRNSNPTCGQDCDGVVPSPMRCSPDDYRRVRFLTSREAPIPGLSLNEQTGIITGIPSTNGLFVLAVCAEEWRDGVLIGEVRRDFQFTVTVCPPVRSLPGPKGIGRDSVIANCARETTAITNSCGEVDIQILNYTEADRRVVTHQWSIERAIGDTTIITDIWEPNITFPGIGQYWVQLIINPLTICADTCETIIDITPIFEASFDVVGGDVCDEVPYSFDASSSILPNNDFEFFWDWGDGNSLSELLSRDRSIATPTYQYTEPGDREVALFISSSSGECKDTAYQDVSYFPLPKNLIVKPTQFLGCRPVRITFDSLFKVAADGYLVEWDFGDGGMSEEISPTHTYENEGTFDININIISPNGCQSDRRLNNLISILDSPEAQFDFSPSLVERLDEPVVFSNRSEGAISYQWDFGDGNRSTDVSPRHFYTEVGQYEVSLVAFQNNGNCTDTLTQLVDVFPPIDPIFPNAFTPNGDGDNDEFFGISQIDGFGEYELTVWSRWGEKVFESEMLSEGWNGRKFNSGQLLPGGVYIYLARFFNVQGEKDLSRGTVLLIDK